jgi:hypothetical protein
VDKIVLCKSTLTIQFVLTDSIAGFQSQGYRSDLNTRGIKNNQAFFIE